MLTIKNDNNGELQQRQVTMNRVQLLSPVEQSRVNGGRKLQREGGSVSPVTGERYCTLLAFV